MTVPNLILNYRCAYGRRSQDTKSKIETKKMKDDERILIAGNKKDSPKHLNVR